MKQIVRLTESDVHRIVEHVITEAIDEITGNQRRVIARYGKDSAESIISGNSTLSIEEMFQNYKTNSTNG